MASPRRVERIVEAFFHIFGMYFISSVFAQVQTFRDGIAKAIQANDLILLWDFNSQKITDNIFYFIHIWSFFAHFWDVFSSVFTQTFRDNIAKASEYSKLFCMLLGCVFFSFWTFFGGDRNCLRRSYERRYKVEHIWIRRLILYLDINDQGVVLHDICRTEIQRLHVEYETDPHRACGRERDGHRLCVG